MSSFSRLISFLSLSLPGGTFDFPDRSLTNYHPAYRFISKGTTNFSEFFLNMRFFYSCRYTYIFGEVTCILQGFASETAANATVLTITAFTIERYVAICHPFMSHTVSKLSRALKHIIIIWLMALCLAIPQVRNFSLLCSEMQHRNLLHIETLEILRKARLTKVPISLR